MTQQELYRLAYRKGQEYASSVLSPGETSVPALQEARQEAPNPKVVSGPRSWFERRDEASDATAEVYIPLTSRDISLRTLRRRLARFLESDDYIVTRGPHGRLTFNVKSDMVGYLTRRLY